LSLPIYGLQLLLGKIILRPKTSKSLDMEFWNKVADGGDNEIYYMVSRETAAFYSLVRILGISPERLLIREDQDLGVLAEDLLEETRSRPDNKIVLVHHQLTCQNLMEILSLKKGFEKEYRIENEPASCPNLCGGSSIFIGFSPAAENWKIKAERVMESDLRGSGKPFLKKLYENLRKLSKHSYLMIQDTHGVQVTASVAETTVEMKYCQSCMMPLNNIHQRKPAEKYCIFCGEDDELLPRHEVQIMIGERLKEMYDNISKREAFLKAGELMKLMPAWQDYY